jgi:hypothetical protein
MLWTTSERGADGVATLNSDMVPSLPLCWYDFLHLWDRREDVVVGLRLSPKLPDQFPFDILWQNISLCTFT